MSDSHRLLSLRRAIQGAPLAVKLMSGFLGLALLFVCALYWQVDKTWHALAMRDLRQRAAVMAAHEAREVAPLVRNGDRAALREFGLDAGRGSAEVHSVQVLDGQGRILLDSNPLDPKEAVSVVTAPLGNGVEGSIRVAMLDSHVTNEVNWMIRRFMLLIGVFVALGLLAAYGLTRRITRPIRELVDATRAVREGDLRRRTPVHAADEVGKLSAAFNDMAVELQRREAVRQHLLRQVIGAAEEERRRVARELHDQAGQTLTALIAGLGAMQADPDARRLADLRHLAAEAYGEVHDLSRTLRPSALDDVGLVAALQEHCRHFASRFDVRVDCEAVGLDGGRLPDEIEVTFYRIVQEALTNAVRHGKARAIQVLLQRRNGNVLAVIEDDGRGFDTRAWQAQRPKSDHLGLLGIEERANLFGGRFNVESRAGAGTGLFVEIPVGEIAHG